MRLIPITFRKVTAGHYRNDHTGVEIIKVDKQRLGRNGYRVAGWSITAPSHSPGGILGRDEVGFATTLKAARDGKATLVAVNTLAGIARDRDEAYAHDAYRQLTAATKSVNDNADILGEAAQIVGEHGYLAAGWDMYRDGRYERAIAWAREVQDAVAGRLLAATTDLEQSEIRVHDPRGAGDFTSNPAERQFCRTGTHPCTPAVTLTFDGGARRLHWCADHAADAEPYRTDADPTHPRGAGDFTAPLDASSELARSIVTANAADGWFPMASGVGFYRAAAQDHYNDVHRGVGNMADTIAALHVEALELDAAREVYILGGMPRVTGPERSAGAADWAALSDWEQALYTPWGPATPYAEQSGYDPGPTRLNDAGWPVPVDPAEAAVDAVLAKWQIA